jgi:hypothetical protein
LATPLKQSKRIQAPIPLALNSANLMNSTEIGRLDKNTEEKPIIPIKQANLHCVPSYFSIHKNQL